MVRRAINPFRCGAARNSRYARFFALYMSLMSHGARWDTLGPLFITHTGDTISIISRKSLTLHACLFTRASGHGRPSDAPAPAQPALAQPASTPTPALTYLELPLSRRGPNDVNLVRCEIAHRTDLQTDVRKPDFRRPRWPPTASEARDRRNLTCHNRRGPHRLPSRARGGRCSPLGPVRCPPRPASRGQLGALRGRRDGANACASAANGAG